MFELEYEGQDLDLFTESSIVTKTDLLFDVKWKIRELESGEEVDTFKNHSAAFRSIYLDLLKKFYKRLEHTHLFDELEPWWSYIYEIDDSGVSLHLQYVGDVEFDEDGDLISLSAEEDFELIRISTRMLTVEEYAKVYDVSVGTVRQWIRRGKLRSAVKAGNEWRIPELSEITGRGYRRGYFSWDDTLSDVPEEYEYLKQGLMLSIEQDEKDKNKFHISIYGKSGETMEILMETKEREKFELYLISNPLIKAEEEHFGSFA